MYALNVLEHTRWVSIENRAQRFWIRSWIDSLHVGTHIHWQLSPLSILSIAHLWEYFKRQDPGRIKDQIASLKVMALRRHADPTLLEPLPALQDQAAWDPFFDRHIAVSDQIHDRLATWHLNSLESCTDLATIYSHMRGLFSSLTLRGYDTDRLFLAVCKAVLDPQNQRGQSPSDNLNEWLQSLAKPEAKEFIAYTKLVPLGAVSKTQLAKWSKINLPSLEIFESDRTLPVLIGRKEPQPYLITRRTVSGSIGALHRREARYVYAEHLQQIPELSIFAFPDRSYFRSTAPGGEEKFYDVSFNRTGISLETGAGGKGANEFQRATRELFDDPEAAIRDLVVAAELRWKQGNTAKGADRVLANAYEGRLRTRLQEDFASYMMRVRAIAMNPRVPAGTTMKEMAGWNWAKEKNYQRLLHRLAARPHIDDELVIARLREMTSWSHQNPAGENEIMGVTHTRNKIADLLSVIRGIRNSATHFPSPADHKLHGIMIYLAKITFEACTAAWSQDSMEGKSPESPPARESQPPSSDSPKEY